MNNEAASPVIGVILMVAITVILAAVIAAFVFGLTNYHQKNSEGLVECSDYIKITDKYRTPHSYYFEIEGFYDPYNTRRISVTKSDYDRFQIGMYLTQDWTGNYVTTNIVEVNESDYRDACRIIGETKQSITDYQSACSPTFSKTC